MVEFKRLIHDEIIWVETMTLGKLNPQVDYTIIVTYDNGISNIDIDIDIEDPENSA